MVKLIGRVGERDMSIERAKRGIAMIELIFSLVIMGIVLLSAPMLIQESIRSGNVALQQEAIAAGASHTAMILSMSWDENNTDLAIGVSPLLDTDREPFDFNISSPPAGLEGVTSRNTVVGAGEIRVPTPYINFGKDITSDPNTTETTYKDFDDVDDYHNSNLGLMVFNNEYTTADIGDYVDVNLTMNTKINYGEDRPSGTILNGHEINITNSINNTPITTRTNLKFITVNLTSNSGVAELDKNITLEAFSCNIGTYIPKGEMKN